MHAEIIEGNTLLVNGRITPWNAIAGVQCDGEEVKYAIAFDTDEGWVEHFDDPPIVDHPPDGPTLRRHRKRGKITFTPGRPYGEANEAS